MSPASFSQTYQQVRNWLHRPSRPRKRRTVHFERPPVLEPLEERMLLAGTWTRLTNPVPSPDGIGTMMLLSDGTVLAQAGGSAGAVRAWYKLTPDSSGSYINGTWKEVASMSLERLYYGSNVLPDGRVFLVGGEYSGPQGQQNFINTGEIYNPVADRWTRITNFPQPMFGDDPTEVLPDGTILAGYLLGPQTYIYHPATDTWTQTGTKLNQDPSDEETWVKLPDGSILTYSIFAPAPSAQRYIPSSGTWMSAGTVPVQLSGASTGFEIGPAFLLPDGRVFFLGATGNTAFYNPSTNSWTAGPVIPKGLTTDDAPGAMMANGDILFAADVKYESPPTSIFEFNPTTTTYTDVTPPRTSINTLGPAFRDRMLVLPTGQVLLSTGRSHLIVYTPSGNPAPSWQPAISGITENGDGTYTLAGAQLNGISEGACYGDDAEMASNYPIVQISDASGHVYYARTFNWSSTGVAAGATPETAKFTLPTAVAKGTAYTVKVIANGIASSPLTYNFLGTALQLNVIPSDNPVTAGTPFTITVRALDSNHNVFTGYGGIVHFTSTDSQASLPTDYTFTSADNGVHTFSVTLKTTGVQTITATDTTSGIIGSASVIVAQGAASQFIVSTSAANPDIAGTPFDVTVKATDAGGNVDPNYRGTIHFTSNDPYGATLPGDYTFTAADAGIHTFSGGATLYTAGTWDITVTDIVTDFTGSASVNVVGAPAVALLVFAPTSATAGMPFDVTVQTMDPYGNIDPNYQGTVHFTSSDPAGATLPTDYTFQAGDQGMHTFPGGATLFTAGTWDVTATDTVSGITGSAFVNVQAAPAVALQITAPLNATSGVAFTVTVTAVDPYGNIDHNYLGTVTWTTDDPDPGVILPPDYTFQASDQGMITFTDGVTLITPGDDTITVTDTVDSTITGSATVTVSPGRVPSLGNQMSGVTLAVTSGTRSETASLAVAGQNSRVKWADEEPASTSHLASLDWTALPTHGRNVLPANQDLSELKLDLFFSTAGMEPGRVI
jgi:hypothetical protein